MPTEEEAETRKYFKETWELLCNTDSYFDEEVTKRICKEHPAYSCVVRMLYIYYRMDSSSFGECRLFAYLRRHMRHIQELREMAG